MVEIEAPQRGDRIANRIEITAYPREVSTQVEVLWKLGHTVRLDPNKPQEVTARYADPLMEAVRIGAMDVVVPEAGTDYTANTQANGGGEDATPYVRVQPILGGSSARLILTSVWKKSQPIYVTAFQLRGVPLRSYLPAIARVQDDASFLAYGLAPLRVDMPLQDDPRVADDMARAWLANRKDSHPWLDITIEGTVSSSLLTHALAREVGDKLAISDTSLALSGAGCFIERIRHEVLQGGASHRVRWLTSPSDLEAYWIIGRSGYAELGQHTTLGY